MSEVNSTFARLEQIWQKLIETNLVKEHVISDESIEEFRKILNTSINITPSEILIGDVIRNLYKYNNRTFYNYLMISEREYLSLYTDGTLISVYLNINHIVDIKWSARDSEFIIRKTGYKKNPSDRKHSKRSQISNRPDAPHNRKKHLHKKRSIEYKKMWEIINKDE